MNTESSGVGLKEQRKKRAIARDLHGKRTFSDQDDANLYFNFISVRLAKFVSRKQWVVPGADDMFICVYLSFLISHRNGAWLSWWEVWCALHGFSLLCLSN